jgi:hypothetical protein
MRRGRRTGNLLRSKTCIRPRSNWPKLNVGTLKILRCVSLAIRINPWNQAARVRLVIWARYAAADFMVIVPVSVSFTISALARRAACAV